MRSAKEAVAYLKKIHTLVRYLEICDGNMQEGSFRCDANVSVRKVGAEKFGTRAEIKNINSFRFVEKAINYEVARQIDVIEGGGKVVQETRLYDPDKGETRSMRSKEEANDYRYFPDPDLLPVEIDAAYIAGVKATLPELPEQKAARFAAQFGLSEYDAGVLTSSKELAAYYEEVAKLLAGGKEPSKEQAKLAANWVAGSLAAALNEHNLEIGESRIGAAGLAGLLGRIADNTISARSPRMCSKPCGPKAKTPTPSSKRRGSSRSPTRAPSRRPSTKSWRRIPASSRTTAPARTSSSASSWARS
jgi:aspartyl-tRNA(Asn)/glutamyl-tRNA(Gln) amidotransferase subunit B